MLRQSLYLVTVFALLFSTMPITASPVPLQQTRPSASISFEAAPAAQGPGPQQPVVGNSTLAPALRASASAGVKNDAPSAWRNIDTLLAAVSSPRAATASTPVAPEPQGVGIEIEPQLQAQLDADGTTTYMIYFRERPDLSPAFQMDWRERGWFVMQALQGAAERSQARVRAYLDAQGARYESFWIDNILVVTRSNRATFNGLPTFPEIKALRARRTMRLIEPVARDPAQIVPMAVEPNISHVQADQVWALGLRGEGSVVASIDTGVRYTHQALVNHYRGTLGGGSYDHNYNWWDPYGSYNYPYDGNGHGTHTMGTMVGDDGGANQIGMAPGAKWMACRGCSTSGCGGAQLLECAQFMAAPWDLSHANVNPDKRPHVVNNSWGDCGTSYDNWYQTVVDNWHAAGIYPVFSNGNTSNCGYSSPPPCGTVGNPARYGNVTGVGSTGQSNGQYASHSNRGPTDNPDTVNPRGYPALKPQVAAPGINIRSSVNTSDTAYEGGWSGTSMSAPHVAGLVALMWQAGQCLKGDYAQTETLIEQTATPITTGLPGSCIGEGPGQLPNQSTGWGEINALAAVQATRNACGPTGALVGVVSNASNGNPIVGAPVQATSSPTQTGSTTSGAGGAYSMTLPVGAYTVTGSAYGYLPAMISGVSIVSGTTTTQDIHLSPAAMRIISGTVKDAIAGWPLYAHIAIQGNPVNPPAPYNDVWTNPVTGFYSATLAESVAYTFTVDAWVPGYNAASRSVGPLTGNRTENLGLNANQETCNAPGYRLTGGLFENFDGVTPPNLPSNWAKVVVTGTYGDWATNAGTRYPSGGGTHSAPNLAYFNSWTASSSNSSRLYRTTGLNMTAVPTTTLSLWMYHDTGYSTYNDRLQVQVSTDGGTTWINVGLPISRYNGTTGWAQHFVDLSAYASQTSLRLGFLGISAYGNDVHFDNVVLGGTCVLQAGGLVVGNTYDANTSAPLAGATVSNDSGRSATTIATVDPAVDDSFYTLFSPAGSHVFTATKIGGYGASIQTPTVVQSSTIRQDYNLPASRLSYTPSGLQVTLQTGLSTTVPFTLTNSGGAAAAFELQEQDRGIAPFSLVQGRGEWLSRSETGVLIDTNRGDTAPAYPSAYRWTPAGGPTAQSILIYADDWIHPSPNTLLDRALQRLGLAYTAHYNGDWAGFETDLISGTWSLVLFGDDNYAPPASTWTALNNYVWGGGRLALYTWRVSSDPGNALWTTLGFTFVSNDSTPPDPVYWWQPSHLIFTNPENVPEFTSPSDIGTRVFGQHVEPLSGFQALAGYTTPGPDPNQAALILGNDGRTVFRGFLDAQNSADLDGDALLDGVELWVNLIDGIQIGFAGDVPWLSEYPVSGTVGAVTAFPISITFTAPITTGIYAATLVVKTNDTVQGTFNIPVTMTVTASPTCGFTTSSPDDVGQVTTFVNTTTGSSPLSYNWNLGDGSFSNQTHPTHKYAQAGLYTVILTATNSWGQDVCNGIVSIEGPPVPEFTSDSPVVLGKPVIFTNTTRSNPPVTAWMWYLGDGTVSTDQTPPPHLYANTQNYVVALIAINSKGIGVYTDTITVGAYRVFLPLVQKQ